MNLDSVPLYGLPCPTLYGAALPVRHNFLREPARDDIVEENTPEGRAGSTKGKLHERRGLPTVPPGQNRFTAVVHTEFIPEIS